MRQAKDIRYKFGVNSMMGTLRRLFRKVIEEGSRYYSLFKLFFIFIEDYNRYRKYSLYNNSCFRKEKIETQMMLLSHSIEKGMSFEEKKQGWGKEKSIALCNIIKRYVKKYSLSEEAINALNVLNNYRNDDCSNKTAEVTSCIDELLVEHQRYIDVSAAGVKKITKPSSFNESEILRFYKSRASVRFYSDIPVTLNEIEKAMEIAYTTPTACNRQTSKVYSILDRTQMNKILDLQYGNQGWADNASAMCIITGSLSGFGEYYERQQVYIDGGLFAMNFIMGLHLAGIACCCKMFVRDYNLQDKIWEICSIPRNEVPIVIIMAGHYKKEQVSDPVSHRFINKHISVS